MGSGDLRTYCGNPEKLLSQAIMTTIMNEVGSRNSNDGDGDGNGNVNGNGNRYRRQELMSVLAINRHNIHTWKVRLKPSGRAPRLQIYTMEGKRE